MEANAQDDAKRKKDPQYSGTLRVNFPETEQIRQADFGRRHSVISGAANNEQDAQDDKCIVSNYNRRQNSCRQMYTRMSSRPGLPWSLSLVWLIVSVMHSYIW